LRIQPKLPASLLGGLVFLHAVGGLPAADESLRKRLVQFAAQAKTGEELSPLRRFAASAADTELRGQAYLALGYREYELRQYPAAAEDLRHAAEAAFPLADFGRYYWALSLREAGQTDQAVEALEGFSARHPASTLRFKALGLLAEMLLRTARSDHAIQVLTAEPRLRQRPELVVLLGQAYRDAGKPLEAARTFQDAYYAFPGTDETRAAAAALEPLRAELGANFPRVTEEIRNARAETLLAKSLLPEALAEYEGLLADQPSSPSVPRWKLGRARCLIRLKRSDEAIDLLGPGFAGNPELDAQRLETLIEAYFVKDDASAALIIFDQLRALYPNSAAFASALWRIGNHYVRKMDWQTAAGYYRTLLGGFPQSPLAPEASWRMAWDRYLQRDWPAATHAFANYLKSYPDSAHAAGALFWLGRIAAEQGVKAEAQQLFRAVQERFVHSYYALLAGEGRSVLDSASEVAESREKFQASVAVAELVRSIPPPVTPPVRPCTPAMPSEVLRPFLTLLDLSLEGLAEDYLIARLSDQPDSPEFLLALARLRAQGGKSSAALFNARRAIPRYAEYEFSALPEEIWNLLYPKDYWTLVQRHARANGLDPYLVMGLIRQESAFNPRAVSTANARGLMQILPSTVSRARHARIRAAQRLFDPAYNVQFGCRHLSGALKTFNGDVERALAAYHAGNSRVKNWSAYPAIRDTAEFLETIPIPATRGYVEAVLRDAAIYRQLLRGTAKFAKCR
jgi:soluble lytic murein transglycosylase